MDSNLLSALMGVVGGLVGVAVGGYLQQRTSHSQLCRETALQLYDRFDDPDLLESRIRADQILSANFTAGEPKCLSELNSSLPREDWHHVSRTRHFLDQVGLLRRIGYLDERLAAPLFANYVNYWVDRYFAQLEELERQFAQRTGTRPMLWLVSSAELKRHFILPQT